MSARCRCAIGFRHGQRTPPPEWAYNSRSHLASCSEDTTIRLWAVDTGQTTRSWPAHPIRTMTIVFQPQPTVSPTLIPLLVSGGCDDLIKVWDVQTTVCVQTLRTPGPYARMNIRGVTGITEAQKVALKALGAVE